MSASSISLAWDDLSPPARRMIDLYEESALPQMSDTVDTLDLPFFSKVVEGLDAALSQL